MSKNKVVHFEIPAKDLKKSKDFYEKIFDWKIELWKDKGGMANTTPSDKEGNPTEAGGINGGFYKRKSKADHPSIVVQTDSITETLKKIKKAGGKVTTAKHEIGEWGFMADFTDLEGNEIGLWEQAKK